MNKKRIAGLLLLLPLSLLSACGGGVSTLPFNANWYRNTTSPSLEGTSERLEYAVTFVSPTNAGAYHVVYNEGIYTTELSAVPYTYDDNTTGQVYRYTTELSISGHYENGNLNSETFEDFSRYTVYFRSVRDNLCPLESHKEMKSSIPAGNPGEGAPFNTEHFTYDVKYSSTAAVDAKLETAHITYVRFRSAEEEAAGEDAVTAEEDVTLEYSGTFLDNEQILFAMRGLELNSTATMTTLNLQNNRCIGVEIPETPTESELNMTDLRINGQLMGTESEGHNLLAVAARSVPFMYQSAQSGPTRTVYYAKMTDAENNTYRNVMLRLDDPIPGGYGTLRYTLRSATFNEK